MDKTVLSFSITNSDLVDLKSTTEKLVSDIAAVVKRQFVPQPRDNAETYNSENFINRTHSPEASTHCKMCDARVCGACDVFAVPGERTCLIIHQALYLFQFPLAVPGTRIYPGAEYPRYTAQPVPVVPVAETWPCVFFAQVALLKVLGSCFPFQLKF